MAYPFTDPPVAPQRGDRATFSARVDAFLNWMVGLIPQLQAFLSNLSSLAAGGTYSLPYKFTASASNIGKGGFFSWPADNNGSILYFDNTSAAGVNIVKTLSSMVNGSTSVIKGQIRVCKINDPSSWVAWNVISFSQSQNYAQASVVFIDNAGVISEGDLVMIFFQRTGDKGDSGNATPVVYVRNQLGNGTAPQTFSANTWNTVQLNNIPYSTIPGVTVSNGVISGLPAGTYWVEASSPCLSSGTHQSRFFNVTDGTVIDNGTSERNDSGTPLRVTRSFIRTAFTINSTKAVRIEHWTPLQTTNGSAASSGAGEIYGEIRLLKVA